MKSKWRFSDRAVARYSAKSVRRKVAGKCAFHTLDIEKMLQFSQQLYAHALTLQEVIRNDGKVTYDALRPRYARQAAQQFEVFYPTSKASGVRARRATSCE